MKSGAGIHPQVEALSFICLGTTFAAGAAPKGPVPDPLAIGNYATMGRSVTIVVHSWEATPGGEINTVLSSCNTCCDMTWIVGLLVTMPRGGS